MSEPKLKAKLFIHAAIRRCDMEAIPIMVVRKGDEDAGTILVKVNRGQGFVDIWTQVRDGLGRLCWMRASGTDPVDECRADTLIAKARDVDWDLWVVELDSPSGKVPFIDRVFGG